MKPKRPVITRINLDQVQIIYEHEPHPKQHIITDSIKRLGLMNPIIVTEHKFQLVSGYARYLACKTLGHKTIDVICIPWENASEYRNCESRP